MDYEHILICTDLSENSRLAGLKALEFANESRATLDILHVIEYSPLAYGEEFSIPIDFNLEQAIESAARKKVAEEAKKLKISLARQHILKGSVKHCATELTKKLNIDLIVLGTNGHHGLEMLLGSRANAILHTAKCDVLAVRSKKNR